MSKLLRYFIYFWTFLFCINYAISQNHDDSLDPKRPQKAISFCNFLPKSSSQEITAQMLGDAFQLKRANKKLKDILNLYIDKNPLSEQDVETLEGAVALRKKTIHHFEHTFEYIPYDGLQAYVYVQRLILEGTLILTLTKAVHLSMQKLKSTKTLSQEVLISHVKESFRSKIQEALDQINSIQALPVATESKSLKSNKVDSEGVFWFDQSSLLRGIKTNVVI